MPCSSKLFRVALLTTMSLVSAACSKDETNNMQNPPPQCPETTTMGSGPSLLGGADCDPLVPTQCGFPFPSSVYLRDDSTTKTGKRVRFGDTTLPRYSSTGEHIDRTLWEDSDGFSTGQPAITHLPGASTKGLPSPDTIAHSLDADSPTVMIDAETGERIPHFAELDVSLPGEDPSDHTFIIRPAVRLKDATRYIVAIRNVVDENDKPVPATPAFEALRDKSDSCDASVLARRDLYADIFSRLEKAGVGRDNLQIAWDYSTSSRDNNTARFLHMRDDALAKVGDLGPEYTITNVEENPNEHIRRRITGKMTVPLYLDKPGPGGKLVLDANGLPTQNGTAEYEFVVHVPNSATTGTPGALLQNGHGLLGSKNEGENGYLAMIADTKNYVAFAVDFVGMANEDFSTVSDSIVGDLGGFKGAVDRQHQGLLNSLLAMRMMRGRFVNEPQVQFDGKSAIDPNERHYRGDSQGGIFGTSYMAVTTDVTRGLLSVPGMNYSLLLNRSADFGVYFLLLRNAYQTGRNIQLVLGVVQMTWDRTEPNGYAPYITENMLPGTPAHQVLLHVGIGDFQVTPLGAHLIARTVGAKSIKPAARSIWGIEEAAAPYTGSGMVEFDFGLPPAPITDIPNTGGNDDDPHGKVRSLTAAVNQEDEFFRTGVIKQYCDNVCDPE
ncbi:Hypothetical protein A7982_00714 [Minicystis rosea]|nr:Hypothetical protein A7982_00714 [Minicystis rosea]